MLIILHLQILHQHLANSTNLTVDIPVTFCSHLKLTVIESDF